MTEEEAKALKIIVLGSGPFAVPMLERLIDICGSESDYELVSVVTRPDRPSGRGRKTQPTPVRQRAEERGLLVEAPESANGDEFLQTLSTRAPDLLLVADYGEFLGKRLRELPRIGTYNLHASLLPRHRGAAPVAHAIRAGDTRSGVTLFRLVREMDAGPIVSSSSVDILPAETAGELEERLALVAARLFVDTLPTLRSGNFVEARQDADRATLAPKLTKEMGRVDWHAPVARVHDHVRAMNPWPGAHSTLRTPEDGLDLRLWRSRVLETPISGDDYPGQVSGVTEHGFSVRCGDADLEILELQRPGKARMNARSFLRGFPMAPGDGFRAD